MKLEKKPLFIGALVFFGGLGFFCVKEDAH